MVVDNASDDGSVEFLRSDHPWVEVLTLSENRFFTGALNAAAEAADTPWLAFLNNDMRVDPGWLHEAVVAAERYSVECVASHIKTWDGSQTQFCGGAINIEGKGFEWSGDDADPEEERNLLFACGGAMLVRRELFLSAGGFDPAYEMIYEDIDFGWRLNLAGHRVAYAPKSVVYHQGHASLSTLDYARKAVCFERNSLATLYKNLEEPRLVPLLPELCRRSVNRAQALAQHGPDGHATLQGCLAFWSRLPYWREQRQQVQATRVKPDAEIPGLITPYLARPWGYTRAHQESIADVEPLLAQVAQMEFE